MGVAFAVIGALCACGGAVEGDGRARGSAKTPDGAADALVDAHGFDGESVLDGRGTELNDGAEDGLSLDGTTSERAEVQDDETVVDAEAADCSAECSGESDAEDEVDATLADAGAPPDASPCVADSLACNGQQPQECTAEGTWENLGGACVDQACINGACVGVCSPGQSQCVNNDLEICSFNGLNGYIDCEGRTCIAGQCAGSCGPGETLCSDGGVSTCTADASWTAPVPCGCGGSCLDGYCLGGAGCPKGVCSGCCTPGTMQCSGTGLQTCDFTATWKPAVPCPSSSTCASGFCETTTAPSCLSGGPGLGDCGGGEESCCVSLEVPGGTYDRMYDYLDYVGTGPGDDAAGVTVSAFRLDKYDVTVGRFRQFVNAVLPPDGGAGWVPPPGSGKHTHLNGGLGLLDVGAPADAGTVYETGWLSAYDVNVAPTDANLACDSSATWTSAAGANETLPIDCVNWYEAYAFCIWDGGFLPSEAEWELAAAGGNQMREYPWGLADPGDASQYAIFDCYYPSGSMDCTGTANIAPVGTPTMGAGLWGQLDLAGNVWQWNLDWYEHSYVLCSDCASLSGGQVRSIRGGPTDDGLLSYERAFQGPAQRPGSMGFRCARVP
jgi:formylglycine-generating enzyme